MHVILDDIGSEFCLSICPYIGFERRPSEEFGDKGRIFKYKFGNARVYDRMNERTASEAAFPHVGKCMSAITSAARYRRRRRRDTRARIDVSFCLNDNE